MREPSDNDGDPAAALSFAAAQKAAMIKDTIELDQHRGMAAQKATKLRRLLADVEADERALHLRQEELEKQLISDPASSWPEAAEKARYLLGLFAATPAAQDPRRQTLIKNLLEDLQRLRAESGEAGK